MWYLDGEEELDNVNPEEDDELDEEDEGEAEDEGDDGQEDSRDNSRDRNNKKKEDKKNDEKDSDSKSDASKGKEGEQPPKSDLDPDKVKSDLQDKSDGLDKAKSSGEGNATTGASGSNAGSGSTTPSTGGAENAMANGAQNTVANGAQTAATNGAQTAVTTGAQTAATTGAQTAATTGTAAATTGAAGGTAGAAATAATPVGWVLLAIIAIIVLIIIVVGILMFFIAMPGQIVSKARSLASNVIKAWSAMIEGEDQLVSTVQLANVANYVESMGYDLKGEGFVTYDKKAGDIDTTINDITSIFSEGYDDSSDLKDMSAEDLRNLLYLDETQGVIRRNDTGDVVDLNSESILSYIISDNQCYIIRNFNTSLDEMTDGNGDLFSKIILGIAAVIGAIVVFLTPVGWIGSLIVGCVAAAGVAGGSYLAVKMNNNPDYGKGLITIWHEGSDIGIADGYYEVSEKGDIALDASTKTLYIKKGWSNGTYTFDVDGWSGRYGMPLEFLLSVHLATQMPELAVEMATSFETDVEVLLHNVKGKVIAGVLKQDPDTGSWASGTEDDDFITYDEVSDIGKDERDLLDAAWEGLKDFGNWVAGVFTGEEPWTDEELEELAFNTRSICELFEEGMPHSVDCECCSHIPGGQGFEDEECSSDDDIFDKKGNAANGHVLCKACQERVWAFIGALKVTNDRKAESYTPYISKVTDHWFRDVYFVMNKDEGEYQSVVKVDEDYFYETGERWTMYETWQEGESIPKGFQVGDYKLYEEGSNTPSNKTKQQVQEDNEKIALGDTSITRLVKKPITQDLSANLGDDWCAYILTGSGEDEATWEKIGVAQDTKNELKNDYVYKNENSAIPEEILIYYKDIRPDDIKQVEDGQRTETNSKIKNMFLNNKYYKYDGSVERADAIIADKSRADNQAEYYNTKIGDSVKVIENDEEKTVTSPGDQRDEKLIAKVNINKDSLGAFSILENTHTLDADYIYRDFKELIVELNYFDKEDLSDKIETVMQWVIPECGSAGWPIRKYEKGENFYGTLINSKEDLSYMKERDIAIAESELAEVTPEEPATEEPETEETEQATTNTSITAWLEKADEVHSIMDIRGTVTNGGTWDYCLSTGSSNCESPNPHPNHRACRTCSDTIQDAVNDNNLISNCSRYVHWVFKELGMDVPANAQQMYNWCKDNGWTAITSIDDMQPGDLLFNNGDSTNDIGHVQLLGEDGKWYNAGSTNAINKEPYAYDVSDFIIAMRPNMIGAAQEFQGYEPDQAVIAPVTGKIVEYGTVERENIETGEKEEVGFVKIQALDHYITSNKGKNVENNCTTEDCEFDMENGDTKEGYDYFYEEYKDVIDSCVLYIEGFDLTLEETLNNTDLESADVTRYKPNEVYNMTNNLKEAQSLWKEDAKTAALPYFKDGDDIYIKEGTVIGKTRADSEVTEGEKGNGNYIRLILRDLEDSIMEDVETYFDIDKNAIISENQPYQAQEGDLELLAKILQKEGCSVYFHGRGLEESEAEDASRATGYVLINRALNNYGNNGTTILEQFSAPGQYSTKDAVLNGNVTPCERCIANAEWCLKYACSSVTSHTTNQPMPQTIMGQSGWCQCDSGKYNCWWWVDTTGDGTQTEYSGEGSGFDTFFCD